VLPRPSTNYDDTFMSFFSSYVGNTATYHGTFPEGVAHIINKTNPFPTDAVTDFDIRGESDGSATLGADELQIHSFTTS